jgi:hypothetical protein
MCCIISILFHVFCDISHLLGEFRTLLQLYVTVHGVDQYETCTLEIYEDLNLEYLLPAIKNIAEAFYARFNYHL